MMLSKSNSINLRDGGELGLECVTTSGSVLQGIPPTKTCPWERISKEALNYYKREPIKSRTKSFEELKQLALEGVSHYWSRHQGNIGKGVKINEELYEVFVNAIYDEEGMVAPKLIYFTNFENTTFNRSHNWEMSRELYYKMGYMYFNFWKDYPNSTLYKNKGWHFENESNSINDFQETSAHEIGHEILLEYGGHIYSKTHKNTSHWSMIIQEPIQGTTYPRGTKEIDLMKYADQKKPVNFLSRVIASERDVLGLIWLTKIISK